MTTKTQRNAAPANDPVQALLDSMSMRTLATKFVISIAYGITLGVAANVILDALLLLSMPAWLHFVVQFAFILAFCYFAFMTSYTVSEAVYDGIAKSVSFTKEKVVNLREWIAARKLASA